MDDLKMLIAKSIPKTQSYSTLKDLEYSVFAQWGDDGIIQYLINNLDISNNYFIEFGVENYQESNTRYLLLNDNWSGLIMDGSLNHINSIKRAPYFWKYDLTVLHSFITRENIVQTLSTHCPKDIGILHIDIDGMDYWIWKEISTSILPDIVILEYNSIFGSERSITLPYKPDFVRHKEHYSGLYAGASLRALVELSKERGYGFIGSNSAGNNAYFVKEKLLNTHVKECSVEKGYVTSKFRESRNKKGALTFLRAEERINEIKGMPVINTISNQIETI